MADLQLFRVTVTQEWSAEGEALVWAEDADDAEVAARAEVDLDLFDADAGGLYTRAKAEPLDTLERLDEKKAAGLWLIVPVDGRPGQVNTVELAEFLSLISPERAEAMRIARIESNNGQLSLLATA